MSSVYPPEKYHDGRKPLVSVFNDGRVSVIRDI